MRLAVRVTVRARRSEIVGVIGTGNGAAVLAVRLAAPPVDGAANDALRRLLSKEAGVPLSRVAIVAGEKARLKLVEIEGDGTSIAARLKAVLGRIEG